MQLTKTTDNVETRTDRDVIRARAASTLPGATLGQIQSASSAPNLIRMKQTRMSRPKESSYGETGSSPPSGATDANDGVRGTGRASPRRPGKPLQGRAELRQTEIAGGERGHRFREPEGYEGYEVHDPLGQKVGSAEKIFADGDGSPKYIRVRLGFFGKSVLIPVEGIGVDAERRTLVLRRWVR